MMPQPGVAMQISTLWEERKVICTPMEHGLRASGIAGFAVREALRAGRAAQTLGPGADPRAQGCRHHAIVGPPRGDSGLPAGDRARTAPPERDLRLWPRP